MGYRQDSKRPGTWVAWFSKRHPDTRVSIGLRRRGFKTGAEARRAEAQMIAEIDRKIRKTVLPLWPALIEEYRISMLDQGLTHNTINNYYVCIKSLTFGEWSDRFVDEISTQEIRELILRRLGQKSALHQRNLLKYIRAGFRFAIEKNYIQRNPTPEMKFRVGDKIKKVLTEAQVQFFLNRAKDLGSEWYPHWCMAVYTGLRNGELYALTWDKVNLQDRRILVDSSWNSKDGFKDTKSGNDRMVEIAPNLLVVLQELRVKSAGSRFVLPRDRRWDKGEQARELRKFLTGIGLPPIRFHDLRATWATLMLSKGIVPIMVMKMGGWQDIKTMQFYVRKAGVDIQGITNDLDLHNPSQTGTVIRLSER